MSAPILQIHPNDNLLVALQDLSAGQTVRWNDEEYQLVDNIPAKHKFSMQPIAAGEPVFLYGVTVGKATQPIARGGLISTENIRHAADPFDYRGATYQWEKPDVSAFVNRTFNGYHRSDGKVGTANYWLFIPTVFCENRNLDVIREALVNELGYGVTDQYKRYTKQLADAVRKGEDLATIQFQPGTPKQERVFEQVDGIKFLNHDGGCGGTRQDSETLGRLLAAYANHPNVGGVTVLSLGCQHLQTADFLHSLKVLNPAFDKPMFVFEQQEAESEAQLVSMAIRQTFEGLKEINRQQRRPAPLSKLTIGVKCGGSDGFSGISANPAVGHAADMLVTLGGTVLLAEFPELCGAEQEMIDRAVDEPTARKFIRLMHDYNALAHQAGSGFHMNPSPGNIRDGLITDAIKSAGAARKAGMSPITDVLDYTEPATKPGLNLVCTPGNDVEATTGKAAAGATLILFTTGLGTPTGNPVCPTIKLATNSQFARRMADIIDIDTGPVIRGEKTMPKWARDTWVLRQREVIKAVQLAQDDFIPWKEG
ncbi:MAG: altronate dehydratase family protein [Flavihumibacter sp.]